MIIKKLVLRNFRNLSEVDIDTDSKINVVWGNNAQGKTNFLEGIYLLGNGKSFRAAKNDQLIENGEGHSLLSGTICKNRVESRVDLLIDQQGKTFRINKKIISSVDEIVALNRQIMFSPQDVGIAAGAPAGRRNIIDRAIFLSRPSYLKKVQDYNRQLKHRNKLLKMNVDSSQLKVWTDNLAQTGAAIRCQRSDFVRSFKTYLQKSHAGLSAQSEEADILLHQGSSGLESSVEELTRDIQTLHDRERHLGITLAGPHRDDPEFHVDGLDLRVYGSQGQQRSFILAFKTALVNYLEDTIGALPILLLDDITSELDKQRKESFLNYLLERGGQVFITTTDLASLLPAGLPEASYYKVHNGRIFNEAGVN
ncbi:MAG: DNA replication/repair protein RecF [Desulfuromonadales bacterium]